MELPQHKTLANVVKADEPDVFMDFTLGIRRLRRINGFVSYLDELAFQRELIASLDFSVTRLSVSRASPIAQQELKRRSNIGR